MDTTTTWQKSYESYIYDGIEPVDSKDLQKIQIHMQQILLQFYKKTWGMGNSHNLHRTTGKVSVHSVQKELISGDPTLESTVTHPGSQESNNTKITQFFFFNLCQ